MKTVSIRAAALAAAALVLCLSFSSCDLLGLIGVDPTEDDTYAANVDLRYGNLAGNVSFPADRVAYVTSMIYVTSGATLTIQPGAVVKFAPDTGIIVESGGRIVADGTPADRIVFTSIKDDTAGGDSLLDGAGVPHAGDWRYIWINTGSSANSFAYCDFAFGGDNSESVLYLDDEADVSYCDFHDNGGGTPGSGIDEAVLHIRHWNAGTSVQYNRFWNNRWPLAMPPQLSLDNTNQFWVDHDGDSETPPAGNTYNVIALDLSDSYIAASDALWAEDEVPFCVYIGTVYVGDEGHAHILELGANTVVKFAGEYAAIWIETDSDMVASEANGNVFTSIADDSALGDSNQSAVAAAADDWWGIWDENLGAGSGDYWPNDAAMVFYAANTP